MIESVMEGDEGIKWKNYKEMILFSREEDTEIERYNTLFLYFILTTLFHGIIDS